jgi:hypothetical protein
MSTNIFRITTDSLIKLVTKTDLIDFYSIKSELSLDETQYVYADDINKTVWSSGTYSKKLNKIYSNTALYTPGSSNTVVNHLYSAAHVMIRQGFSWDNVFGLHLLITDSNTNEVLVSRIIESTDFSVTSSKELISGSFWLEECIVYIPTVSNVLSAQITTITYDDISSDDGSIYNYPNDSVVLVEEKPTPDYIKCSAILDSNNFLNIKVTTTENKTVEQSILDYFDVEDSEITVNYLINYGNETTGYYTYKISNEDYKYNIIKFALDLSEFTSTVEIVVTCQIYVDSKLMTREVSLTTDIESLNTLISAQITHPDTNYPVTVSTTNTITQTKIETSQKTKIIAVYQPVFCELITDSFVFELKNIIFDKLVNPTYLKLIATDSDDEQILLSETTTDSKFYFDLSKFTAISEATTYELYDATTLSLIGKGTVTI